MTIDNDKLISLLVNKTGLERDQVEKQLSELGNSIQQAARGGEPFEIEGFGTFRKQENRLAFEPSDKLETEINNRYAGMKPIELIGAFKEPEKGGIPDRDPDLENDHDIWGFDETAIPSQQDRQANQIDPPSQGDKGVTDSPKSEKIEAQRADTGDVGGGLEEYLAERTEEEKEEKPMERRAEKGVSADASAPDSPKEKPAGLIKRVDSIGNFLLSAVIVLVVGFVGWFAYDMTTSGEPGSPPFQNESSHPAAGQQGEPVSADAAETPDKSQPQAEAGENRSRAPEPEAGNEVPTSADRRAEPEEGGGPRYGLYGSINENITRGYTIIVHSLQTSQQATAMRESLNKEGYRVVVSEATIGGTTYFRVGIGQFETVSDAQTAAAELLPDHFKNNHFIKRI